MRIIGPKKVALESDNKLSVGSVVEYELHGEPVLAIIIGEKRDKWTLSNAQGAQLDLPAARLYLLPGRGPVEPNERVKFLEAIDQQAEILANEIRLDELWAVIASEGKEASSTELTELALGENSLVNHAATRRKLLVDQVYFKRKKTSFEPRSEETVEQLSKQQRAEEGKRQERKLLVDSLIKKVKDPDYPLPPTIQLLEDYAALGKSADDSKEALEVVDEVISKLNLQLTDKGPNRCFQLLVAANHFSIDENLTLFRLGRSKHFPTPLIDEATALIDNINFHELEQRKDCRHLLCLTIDNEGTRDRDDALSVETLPDGFRIGIHISDVDSVLPPGSALEKDAFERAISVYTPDAQIPMLPPVLSENALSLSQGKSHPVMSFFIEFDKNFHIRDREISATLISIAHQLTYEEADKLMEDENQSTDLHFTLGKLWDATCVIEALRLQAGASQFSRREMTASILPDGRVGLEEASEDTPSHKLVGEMAILANETAAVFSSKEQIPMIFRSQEAPDVNPEEQGLDIPEGPARDFFQRGFLKRSVTAPLAGPHYGLGLSAYLQITSPIRRASDLINQRQLGSFLRTGKPRYSAEEVEELLVSLEGGLDEASQIQRERNRYFLLKYLVQEGIKHIDATIMKTDGPKPLLELDQVFLISPFHSLTNSKDYDAMRKRRGEKIRVMIDQIDPRSDTLVLREVAK